MTAGKDWNTKGKSIESIIVKSRSAWLASALSVVVNAQADARPMYKQRSWQAVTNLRLKTASLVVRAL